MFPPSMSRGLNNTGLIQTYRQNGPQKKCYASFDAHLKFISFCYLQRFHSLQLKQLFILQRFYVLQQQQPLQRPSCCIRFGGPMCDFNHIFFCFEREHFDVIQFACKQRFCFPNIIQSPNKILMCILKTSNEIAITPSIR